MSFSNNNVWLALLFTALACLILGMEVPTTAAYIICVTVAGPALIDMGLDILLVHLFVFWFALLSTITPPVCGTVFIAAGMVNENWVKVSITSMILGLGLYFIPLGMVSNPSLIKLGSTPIEALIAMFKISICLLMFSFSIIKAKHFSKKTGKICIADDSGLEIDILDKAPGIYSARWGGKKNNFNLAIKKVYRKLELVDKEWWKKKIKSRFVCAITIYGPKIKTKSQNI